MPGKAPPTIQPNSLSDYFEVLTKAVFQSGISWGVIEARWGGLTAAFDEFDPQAVAGFTPQTVDRLMQDARVVRNRRKLEATIVNAAEIVALDREYGGFRNYLRSHPGYEALVEDLKRRFRMLGDRGAWFFLHVVGEDVPAVDEPVALRH
jgi:DNA-3-methyladenine glycosylase I